MKASSSFFLILLVSSFVLPGIFNSQPVEAVTPKSVRGSNFLDIDYGNDTHKWQSAPEWILDNGVYKPYKLFEDASIVQIETMQGSFIFGKNSCALNFYNSGIIGGQQPVIGSDNYIILGTTLGNQNFVKVNQINNAACQTEVIVSGNNIEVRGTKHVDNVGTFKIRYIKNDGDALKTQLEPTNENPAWNNHKLGITQTMEVPQFVTLGNTSYNLANFNNTVLNRQWLVDHDIVNKLIKLSDRIKFDFDIGFQYVEKITILWDGTQAKLTIDYWYNTPQIAPGQTLTIDPTFTSTDPTVDGFLEDADNNNNCDVSPASFNKDTAAISMAVGLRASASTEDCQRVFVEYNLSSISASSTVTDSDFTYDVTSIVGSAPDFCDFVGIGSTGRPSTASNTNIWAAIGSGTVFVNADASCDSAGDNKALDLSATGDTYFTSQLASGWGAIGIKRDVEGATDATERFAHLCSEEDACTPDPTLVLVYTVKPPDRVTVLTATRVTGKVIDLDWTAPNSYGNPIIGYQINYTTPYGTPLTITANNASGSITAGTVSGLTELTQYSFRVSVRISGGAGNPNILNATGKILNVTTLKDFSVGSFNVTGTNPNIIQMLFKRIDINSTSLFLNVTYSKTFHLSCNFHYKYANINKTYTNLSNVTVDANRVRSDFKFLHVDNEVIDTFCWDDKAGAMLNNTKVNNTNSGKFIITQTSFKLLQQINDFKTGKFGTQGDFGALDFVTLIAIILSMIGLNRVNETVGGIFSVAIIGLLAYFGIIEPLTIILSAVALVVMLIISTTRKD